MLRLVRVALRIVAASTLTAGAPVSRAAPPVFLPVYSFSETDGTILCSLVHDNQLYVGGTFTTIGGISASRVARWDGMQYHPLGTGLGSTNTSTLGAKALCAYGGRVIVAGNFSSAGGLAAGSVAAWNPDTLTWETLGDGLGHTSGTTADARCAVAADVGGTGLTLYVGGSFNLAGGAACLNVGAWNGAAWSDPGGGVNAGVNALAAYNGGLYAGCTGTSSNRFRYWTGTGVWNQVPGGTISGNSNRVNALLPLAGDLYVGGSFTNGGGITTSPNIVKYNGGTGTFTGLGAGLPDSTTGVSCLVAHDDGSGPRAVAGGGFAGNVAAFVADPVGGDGWQTVADGLTSAVRTLASYSAGQEHDLFAGTTALLVHTPGMAWTNPGDGLNGQFTVVTGLHAGPSQPDPQVDPNVQLGYINTLFIAGVIATRANMLLPAVQAVREAARRTQCTNNLKHLALASHNYLTAPLSTGLTGGTTSCGLYRDGTNVYMAYSGTQTTAGGQPASGFSLAHITGPDSSTWTWTSPTLPAHFGGFRGFFAPTSNGGPPIYLFGDFNNTGTPGLDYFGRLSGDGSFAPVACGPRATIRGHRRVQSAGHAVHRRWGDYATTGCPEQPSGFIDTFDPATETSTPWASAELNGSVYCTAESPLESAAPGLYAGGTFTSAGPVALNQVAYWNGAAWEALGSGLNGVATAMTFWDDGEGLNLYVAGAFTTAGGQAAHRLARWDGASWSAVWGGGSEQGTNAQVNDLAVIDFDDGHGPSLVLGGSFTRAGGYSSGRLAHLVAVGAPVIALHPVGALAAGAGETATISVRAYRSPPLMYQWYHEGAPLSDDGHFTGSQTATLSVNGAQAADAGAYTCVVSNAQGSATSLACQFTVGPSCRLDYNLDGVRNPDDIGDFITDYFTDPPLPGPGGYAVLCPENPPPYDAGYKAAYTPDGGGQCNPPFPDNVGDWITDYFEGAC